MTGLRIGRLGLICAAALAAASVPAAAQVPARDAAAAASGLLQVQFQPRPGAEPRLRGGLPGRFDYYALVLSWSPTYCAGNARPGDTQCSPRGGRPYSFVLHGLWPQYERGWPQDCPTGERAFVPQSTIDRMMDIMPSRNLIIHEYRKHGVCSGLGVEGYFDMARTLFGKVKVPQRFQDPDQNQMVETSAVVAEFVAANPGLKPDMLAVVCGGPGNRLREIRICVKPDGQYRPCGGNERRTCDAPRVFVPPVRLGPAGFSRGGPDRNQDSAPQPPRIQPGPMLPGPVAPGQRQL